MAFANATLQMAEVEFGIRKSFDFKTMLIIAAANVIADSFSSQPPSGNSSGNTETTLQSLENHAIKGLIKLGAGDILDENSPMLLAKFLGDQAVLDTGISLHKTYPP